MKKLTLYSTDACSFCVRAKRLLDARGLEYEDINLARDPDGRSALASLTGMMSFPQILVDDELVGGYTELAEAERSGRLTELLAAAA